MPWVGLVQCLIQEPPPLSWLYKALTKPIGYPPQKKHWVTLAWDSTLCWLVIHQRPLESSIFLLCFMPALVCPRRRSQTPYCDSVRSTPLQLTCRQDQLAVAVCNLQKYPQALPLEYQVKRTEHTTATACARKRREHLIGLFQESLICSPMFATDI